MPAASPLPALDQPKKDEVKCVASPADVARKAYFTYINEGSQPGRDVQHWLDAEAQLLAERNLTRAHEYQNQIQRN